MRLFATYFRALPQGISQGKFYPANTPFNRPFSAPIRFSSLGAAGSRAGISPQSDEHPFGKVLVSSNERGKPDVSGIWISGLLLAGALTFCFFFVSYAMYDYGKTGEDIFMAKVRKGDRVTEKEAISIDQTK